MEISENYYLQRRSCRNFTDRAVSDEMLRQIVRLAMKAPTCGNMQLYSIVSSRRGPGRAQLEALHFNQPAAVSADVILTVCADMDRFEKWCRVSGADPGYDNFLTWTSAYTDATILAQQITTIAEQMGLGTCYLGTVMYNAPEIADLLHLPPHVTPVAALAIGYPAAPGEETERLDVDGVLFDEHYPDLNGEQIKRIYEVKDNYPANRGFVKENGSASVAHLFTDIRYTRQTNEAISDKLTDYLRRCGLLK